MKKLAQYAYGVLAEILFALGLIGIGFLISVLCGL